MRLDPATLPLVGTSFIEASAGTGKTYALTTLYVRLVVERDLLPAEILVVTFTNAATAELRERIRDRLRAAARDLTDETHRARLARALRRFDEAAIFTIHGFCQRTLAENAFESGLAFETELLERPDAVHAALAHDLANRLLAPEPLSFRAWLGVGAGRRWAFEPEALAQLIKMDLAGDDEMPLVPALDGAAGVLSPEALEALVDAADAAWLRFVSLWREQGDAIVELLCSADVPLNRGKFRPKSIRSTWREELDAACELIEGGATPALRAGHEPPARVAGSLTCQAIAAGTNAGKAAPSHPFFDAATALDAATGALSAAFDARALALRRRFVEAVREAAAVRRREHHVLFFDDLIGELRRAVRGPKGERLVAALRARHRVALIDEFQDTDAAQYEIFKTVWHGEAVVREGGGLILIGDPKQAIYAFRGADVETYLAARGDAGTSVRSLGVNHRSDPEMIDAVNALFGASPTPFAHPSIEFRPVAPADPSERDERPRYAAPERFAPGLRVSFLGRDAAPNIEVRFARTAWMAALARDVAELLESNATIGERRVKPSDIAILARRRSELEAARRALEALGIACVVRAEGDVFDAREAWELASVLAAWLHPGDPARLRAALSSGAHGLDAVALVALGDDTPELAAIAERMADYGRLWQQQGFARAFETWFQRERVDETLLGHADGDRRLTNWRHLAELLGQLESKRSASRSGMLAWLERAIGDPALRIELGGEASLLRLERDDAAVSLVTLHGSKGLEYEIVYLPALWESFESRDAPKGNLGRAAGAPEGEEGEGDAGSEHSPDANADAGRGTTASATRRSRARRPIRYFDDARRQRTLDLGSASPDYEDHAARAQAEREAEHRRLLYVGLTRARRHCVVLWGCVGSHFARSPLARLLLESRAHDAPGDSQAYAKWAKGRADGEWLADWQAIAARAAPGAIRIEPSELGARGRWRPDAGAERVLEFVPPVPLALRARATTSFSALVRAASRASTSSVGPLATGRDLDAEVESTLDSHPEGEASIEARSPDLAGDMHLFPRGAEAGTLLHEVLERVDLARPDRVAIEQLARRWTSEGGLDPGVVGQVVHVVESVARTPLSAEPHPLRLGDLPRGQLLPELEFTLAAPGDHGGHGFSAEALAEILSEAPSGSALARYAPRARSLAWPALVGHLRGFIDAVFSDGERYYVVDYKSNHLGATREDYLPERLLAPMIEHDYMLQALLYCVALDRHLAARLVDYDYERHFGGAYYLFLRGLAEAHPVGCGVFFDRPDERTLRRVSDLLGRVESEAKS